MVSETLLYAVIALSAYGFDADSEAERLVRAAEVSLHRLDLSAAEQHLVEALAASESDAIRAVILNNLGFVYHKRGKYGQAERCYLRAIHLWQQIPGADELSRARSIVNLASHYVETRQFVKAESLGLEALTKHLSGPESASREFASLLVSLGVIERSTGYYAKAEGHLLQAFAVWDDLAPRGAEALEVLNNLALVYEQAGKPDDALHTLEHARQAAHSFLHPSDPLHVFLLANAAALQFRAHRLAEAELLFQQALSLAESSLGADHPIVGRMLCNYAVVLRSRKKRAEAAKLAKRGAEILSSAADLQSTLLTVAIADLAPSSAKRK